MCFVPLDLRVSLNFAHICEQLFKAKFQAIFLDRCQQLLRRTKNKAFSQRLYKNCKKFGQQLLKFQQQLFGFFGIPVSNFPAFYEHNRDRPNSVHWPRLQHLHQHTIRTLLTVIGPFSCKFLARQHLLVQKRSSFKMEVFPPQDIEMTARIIHPVSNVDTSRFIGVTSQFVLLETINPFFASSSFVIRVNLLYS